MEIKALFKLWFPTAISDLTLTAEIPVILIFISHGRQPISSLAAFGVILSLILLINNPMQPIAVISAALGENHYSHIRLRKFSICCGFLISLLLAVISLTPLSDWLLISVIGLSPSIAVLTKQGLYCFIPLPLAVSLRRLYEGVLISQRRTKYIAYASWWRLFISFLSVVLIGKYTTHWSGVMIGSVVLMIAVMSQTVFIILFARKYVLTLDRTGTACATTSIAKFYFPLAIKAFFQLLYLPLISLGIAHGKVAAASLAAWSVLYAFIDLLQSTSLEIDALAKTVIATPNGNRNFYIFCFILSVCVFLVFLIFLFTPLSNTYFVSLNGLGRENARLAINAAFFALPGIFFMIFRSYWQGMLIALNKTVVIQNVAAISLIPLLLVIILGNQVSTYASIYTGVAAFSLSITAEFALLWYCGAREKYN